MSEKPITELPFSKRKSIGKQMMSVGEFKATIESEDHLQLQCEEYLNLMKVPFVRIPDAVYNAIFNRYYKIPAWIQRIASDYLTGLPDLMIIDPFGEDYNRIFCVELKVKKNTASQGQKNFAKRVNTKLIRNFDDFKVQVDSFLNYKVDIDGING